MRVMQATECIYCSEHDYASRFDKQRSTWPRDVTVNANLQQVPGQWQATATPVSSTECVRNITIKVLSASRGLGPSRMEQQLRVKVSWLSCSELGACQVTASSRTRCPRPALNYYGTLEARNTLHAENGVNSKGFNSLWRKSTISGLS